MLRECFRLWTTSMCIVVTPSFHYLGHEIIMSQALALSVFQKQNLHQLSSNEKRKVINT